MSKIKIYSAYYFRKIVETDSKNMYIFTDNLDRSSGYNPIITSSNIVLDELYVGKHYPNVSQATIRGLTNAYPITTKKGKYPGQFFTDKDALLFYETLSNDIVRIKNDMFKFESVYFSIGGFATEKSTLPYILATKLSKKLQINFGLVTELIKNNGGYGLSNLKINDNGPIIIS